MGNTHATENDIPDGVDKDTVHYLEIVEHAGFIHKSTLKIVRNAAETFATIDLSPLRNEDSEEFLAIKREWIRAKNSCLSNLGTFRSSLDDYDYIIRNIDDEKQQNDLERLKENIEESMTKMGVDQITLRLNELQDRCSRFIEKLKKNYQEVNLQHVFGGIVCALLAVACVGLVVISVTVYLTTKPIIPIGTEPVLLVGLTTVGAILSGILSSFLGASSVAYFVSMFQVKKEVKNIIKEINYIKTKSNELSVDYTMINSIRINSANRNYMKEKLEKLTIQADALIVSIRSMK